MLWSLHERKNLILFFAFFPIIPKKQEKKQFFFQRSWEWEEMTEIMFLEEWDYI